LILNTEKQVEGEVGEWSLLRRYRRKVRLKARGEKGKKIKPVLIRIRLGVGMKNEATVVLKLR